MKDLLNRVKRFFDKVGFRKPDFWAVLTLVLAAMGIFAGSVGLVGLAVFPAFLAGLYFALDSWDDDDDDDDEPDDEDETVNPDPDYQLYA